jgi:Putative MetA-pathway of phenol degradation
MPAGTIAEKVGADSTPETMAGPETVAQPGCCPGSGMASPACCPGELGCLETITQSLFGKPDPNCWRPLPLSTFFSEGWNEAWVPSPNGSGGAPRQGWINAADGNLYRLGFFTFAQGFNNPPDSTAYLGAYTLLTPLSRRLELITNVPFVLRNSAAQGLPILSPTQQLTTITQSHTGFGDISITPRVLVHETKDFSVTAELAVLTPTGDGPLAGKTALTPAVAFWNNICGRWVIRGGTGLFIPMQGAGDEALISQTAIGQTLTDHDVPWFGDFTYYLSAVAGTPLAHSDQTSVALTPGIRTHLGHDWYFLAGAPTPVTKQRVADLGLICWLMKAW